MMVIKTTLDNILDLINVAEDYGFGDDVLLDAFAEMMGYKLSDQDIEKFAKKIQHEKDCTIEDYNSTFENLMEFKERYCKKN